MPKTATAREVPNTAERVDLGDVLDVEAGILKTRQIEEQVQEGHTFSM